jgi:predicted AlkP superfamily phosphohydrolase/phosphomutase
VQVTAWGGHDPAYPRSSRPVGLLRELDERFGPHPAFDNDYTIVWNRPRDIDALADALVVGSRRRADALQWLQAREPDWDLAMTVLSEPHSANEQLWHGVDVDPPVAPAGTVALAGRRLREVYRAVDDALGRIVAGLPDDAACVVFSMHGSGRNSSDLASMVLLPELLHRMHAGRPFLRQPDTAAWAAAGRPPVLPGADTSWPVYMRSLLPDARGSWRHRLPPGVRAAYRALRAARPDGTRRGALGRPITDETDESPADIGVIRTTVDWQVPVRYRSHWSAMRAFAVPSFYDGRVRINLQGRERDGIVPADEYELACREVEEVVSACRDPRTHEPVVAEVRRLRDDDPFLPGGPDADLEIVWSHATDSWEHPVAGTIGPFPYRRTGGHSRRGFALVAGPGIEPQDLGERQALDVTATIVALLGRDPVAAGMEGTPLVALALD